MPKKNEKWKTCQDFMDLNKIDHEDNFLFPRIDQPIDATMGHELSELNVCRTTRKNVGSIHRNMIVKSFLAKSHL